MCVYLPGLSTHLLYMLSHHPQPPSFPNPNHHHHHHCSGVRVPPFFLFMSGCVCVLKTRARLCWTPEFFSSCLERWSCCSAQQQRCWCCVCRLVFCVRSGVSRGPAINSLGLPCRGALRLGLNPSLPDGHGTSKTSAMITSTSKCTTVSGTVISTLKPRFTYIFSIGSQYCVHMCCGTHSLWQVRWDPAESVAGSFRQSADSTNSRNETFRMF